MFESLEVKGQTRELQKATKKTDKFLSGDSKHRNMPRSVYEKDHRYPDTRFLDTDHLRYEYGDNHIWNVPIQRQPIIQMYHRMTESYDRGEIIWNKGEKNEFWITVDAGLDLAKTQLKKGMNERTPVKRYAIGVLDILNHEELRIYPMTGEGRVGQAAYNDYAISLEVNFLKNNVPEMAKTLIHEAFHIFGGCWKRDKKGNRVYNEKLDVECKAKGLYGIYYREFRGKRLISTKADAFAQYIMLL